MTPWRALALAFVLIGAAPPPAAACSCVVGRPVCETFWDAESVFTGTVVSIGREPVTDFGRRYEKNLITFGGVTVYRGEPAESMQVRTGHGGGDCGYAFEVGRTYIVYTHRARDGRLETGICERTAPIEKAQEDLTYLRNLSSSSGGTLGQIVGAVRQDVGEEAAADRPPPPVTLTLTGARQVTIDSHDGRFDARVPPGKYDVEVRAPAGFYAMASPDQLFVADARACASVQVHVRVDGRIAGRVVDASGMPVAGIGVHAAPAREGIGHLHLWGDTNTLSDNEGRFVVSRLTPGEYLVGPYVPGVPRSASAARDGEPTLAGSFVRVRVDGPGEHDVGTLRLPEGLEIGAIRGTVVMPDGTPAAGVRVSLDDPGDVDARFDHGTTDDQGRFTLAAPAGRRYVVVASHTDLSIDERGKPRHANWEAKTEAPVAAGDTVALRLRRFTTP